MPSEESDQAAFAANLQAHSRGGFAVYHLLEFGTKEGRVGDIAFFDSGGTYRWLGNAFDTEAPLAPYILHA
jgi:hypothetical protein